LAGRGSGFFLDEFPAAATEEFPDEVGGIDAPAKFRVMQDGFLERNGRLDAGDDVLVERTVHLVHGVAPVGAVGDELGHHRVVVARDGVAGVGVAVESHTTAAGRVVHLDLAGAGAEVIPRILGVDAALDGVAAELDVALRELQRLAHGDKNLLLDEVDASDLLGDGVLDLDALVDLEEVEVALVVDDELDGAGVGVLCCLRNLDCRLAHLNAQFLMLALEKWRGRFLDELLVSALDGAVALPEVDDVALVVTENLELDVARVLDEFLDVNPAVGKRLFSLAAGGVVALDQRDVVVGSAHSAASAAGHGLDHHRVANFLGGLERLLLGLDDVLRSGRDRHAGLAGQLAADGLVLQRIHRFGLRANEADVAVLADLGEVGVLGEEPVAGVNGIDVRNLGCADDAIDPQVTLSAGRAADADGFVRHLGVHGVRVRLRVHRHGADVQLLAGANDPDGDLPAIGYQ
jgi:hypothetical protein